MQFFPSPCAQLKLKSTLRLLIPRLRMAQKKDTAVSIAARREMATLLEQSREASARIRVENIIQTDIRVEPPPESLVTAYLEEIARTYGVEWPRRKELGLGEGEGAAPETAVGGEDEDEDEDDDAGVKEMPIAIDTGAGGKGDVPAPSKK